MKRTFTILLFAIVCIFQTNAQIQRSFFGCTFGANKQTVKQAMAGLGYSMHDKGKTINCYSFGDESITFGGYNWYSVIFEFYNDSLLAVAFNNNTDAKKYSPANISNQYERLVRDLDTKYNQFKRETTTGTALWQDEQTSVACHCICYDEQNNCVDHATENVMLMLYYTDNKKTLERAKSERSEL